MRMIRIPEIGCISQLLHFATIAFRNYCISQLLHFATIAFRNYRAASLRQSAKSKVNIFFARAPKCKVESQFKFYVFIN
jgi:hypothetical protein